LAGRADKLADQEGFHGGTESMADMMKEWLIFTLAAVASEESRPSAASLGAGSHLITLTLLLWEKTSIIKCMRYEAF
jgi:hypothetical protein